MPPDSYLTEETVPPAPPPHGIRVRRALLWGPLYGQWWTISRVAVGMVVGSIGVFRGTVPVGTFLSIVLAMAALYGVAGCCTAMLIAFRGGDRKAGAAIGVGAGVLLCLVDAALGGNALALVYGLFYCLIGYFIGTALAVRIWNLDCEDG